MAILFTNGALFDGHLYVGAGEVLVDQGRILACGDLDKLDHRGRADEVVDLQGGLLAPGFVDAHVHAVQGGLERTRCDLTAGETRDDYLRLIRAYADAHPDRPWILGGGWA